MPKAALLGLLLLGVAEGAARVAVSRGILRPDPSLRVTLENHIDQIRRDHPPVWWLGNSTLDWGIEASPLEQNFGVQMVKLPHGGATLHATAEMLQFYIDNAKEKPRQVIVTLTKDDLNTNGSRAELSQQYTSIATKDELPPTDWLMLRRARSNLRAAVVNAIHHRHAPTEAKPKAPVYDGTPLTTDFAFNVALVKHFQLDTAAFGELKAVCDKNGLPAPLIILMPVTDQYVAFHDRMTVQPKYEQIHQQVVAAIAANGMTCLDYWSRPRTDYNHYRDSYHLNPIGAALLTTQLEQDLAPIMQRVKQAQQG